MGSATTRTNTRTEGALVRIGRSGVGELMGEKLLEHMQLLFNSLIRASAGKSDVNVSVAKDSGPQLLPRHAACILPSPRSQLL